MQTLSKIISRIFQIFSWKIGLFSVFSYRKADFALEYWRKPKFSALELKTRFFLNFLIVDLIFDGFLNKIAQNTLFQSKSIQLNLKTYDWSGGLKLLTRSSKHGSNSPVKSIIDEIFKNFTKETIISVRF